MTFRAYLFLMSVSTVLAWVGWVTVLFNVKPLESGLMGFFLFYITLSVGMVGTLTLAGLVYRVIWLKTESLLSRDVKISFRHAVLLTAVSIIALILSAQGLLHWWVLIVLIVPACIIEFLSLLVQHSRRG
jgi:hypothetical protein